MYRLAARLLGVALWITMAAASLAQEATYQKDADKEAFSRLQKQLAQAQRQGDEAAVNRMAAQGQQLLGAAAGVPETPDEFRPLPAPVAPLTPDEIPQAFAPYLRFLEAHRWWKVGLNPAETPHLPREVASEIVGCLAARRAGAHDGERLLAQARQAGEYLVWTQEQAGTGGIPFPAVQGGRGRALEVADRFLQRAEQAGLRERVVHNGWLVDDLGDGGLQFDNGRCGLALFDLYEATHEQRFLTAARATADWAAQQPAVPNWNYNSFSVELLAQAFTVTHQKSYRDAAVRKARLGLYPGQLTEGPRAGRWADPHNARPAYHYILVRGLAALVRALPTEDPDRAPAMVHLQRALQARNGDFGPRGVPNLDSALEALLLVKSLPADAKLDHTGSEAAFEALQRVAVAGYRSQRGALEPGVWGQYLAYVAPRPRR